MRDRIDLRWIIVTTVVVAVAAAGAAATMKERAPSQESPEAAQEARELSHDRAEQRVARLEPPRLSYRMGASAAELPAFQSEALPPGLAGAFGQELSNRRESSSATADATPTWSPRRAARASGPLSDGTQPMRMAAQGGAGIGWPAGSIASNTRASGGHESQTSGQAGGGNGSPAVTAPGVPRAPSPSASGAPAAPPVASPVVGGSAPAPGNAASAPAAPAVEPPTGGGISNASSPVAVVPRPALFDGVGDPGDAPGIAGPGALAATPEPGSLILLGTGLVGIAGALRRRLK